MSYLLICGVRKHAVVIDPLPAYSEHYRAAVAIEDATLVAVLRTQGLQQQTAGAEGFHSSLCEELGLEELAPLAPPPSLESEWMVPCVGPLSGGNAENVEVKLGHDRALLPVHRRPALQSPVLQAPFFLTDGAPWMGGIRMRFGVEELEVLGMRGGPNSRLAYRVGEKVFRGSSDVPLEGAFAPAHRWLREQFPGAVFYCGNASGNQYRVVVAEGGEVTPVLLPSRVAVNTASSARAGARRGG